MASQKKVPWLLWPFHALWQLLALILQLTGRVLGIILGLLLLIAGIVLSLTVVGAVVGVPLALLGFMLMLRGLF
jgi:hypothetical protein